MCGDDLSVRRLSDDFQSTFTVVDENTLVNLLGFDGDFEKLTLTLKMLPLF